MSRESNSKVAIIINRFGMGEAPVELSHQLIKNYLALIYTEGHIPSYLCLYANGVKLACEGSPVLEELRNLERGGCKIIICKSCLLFNQLLGEELVGSVGTMLDIVEIQHNSTKVITI